MGRHNIPLSFDQKGLYGRRCVTRAPNLSVEELVERFIRNGEATYLIWRNDEQYIIPLARTEAQTHDRTEIQDTDCPNPDEKRRKK